MNVVAKDDPTYSFLETGKNLFHFYSGNDSQFLGASFEIIKKILTNLNIKYTFQIVPKGSIETMLKNGDADIALDVQKNNKMLSLANFPSIPMRTQNYVFFGRLQEAKGTTMTYEDVLKHNYTVGINIGTLYPKEFWNAFPFEERMLNSHLIESSTVEENIRKLKAKKIDIFLADTEPTLARLQKSGDNSIIFQYKNILYWKDFYCVFSKKSKIKNRNDIEMKVQKSLYKMQEGNQLKEINTFWMNKKI